MIDFRVIQEPSTDARTGDVIAHYGYNDVAFRVSVTEEWLSHHFPDINASDALTIFNARRAEVEDQIFGMVMASEQVPPALVLKVRRS